MLVAAFLNLWEICCERAWLPPYVVLVINDNLYGLMCALSYICSVGP